jgi:hypothetical protein
MTEFVQGKMDAAKRDKVEGSLCKSYYFRGYNAGLFASPEALALVNAIKTVLAVNQSEPIKRKACEDALEKWRNAEIEKSL